MPIQYPKCPLLYQCPLCKELVRMGNFAACKNELVIECDSCEGSFAYREEGSKEELPDAKKSDESEKEDVGLIDEEKAAELSVEDEEKTCCPKCSFVSKELEECPRCGLAFANVGITFQPFDSFEPANPNEEQAVALWSKVLDNWEEDTVHEKFLQFITIHELYELASRAYRSEKKKRGDDAFVAEEKLERLLDLVQEKLFCQTLEAPLSSEERTRTARLLILLALIGVGAFFFFMIFQTYLP